MIQCDDIDLHPILYRTFMITLSIVTPPVNGFALYCIAWKSPKQMDYYKWYLLAYQLTSSTFDFVFAVLIVPVVFFPIPMGYADSPIARWTSLSAQTSLIIFISSIPFLAVCILSLFSYRCQLIIPQHHFLKTNQKGQFHFAVILLAVYSVPVSVGLMNISPDQAEAKQWVLEEYSCAESVIDAPRLHIYTSASIRPLVITASVLGIFAMIFLLCTLWLSFHSLNKGEHLSQKTRLLQRRFLIYLCVQVIIRKALVTLCCSQVLKPCERDSCAELKVTAHNGSIGICVIKNLQARLRSREDSKPDEATKPVEYTLLVAETLLCVAWDFMALSLQCRLYCATIIIGTSSSRTLDVGVGRMIGRSMRATQRRKMLFDQLFTKDSTSTVPMSAAVIPAHSDEVL